MRWYMKKRRADKAKKLANCNKTNEEACAADCKDGKHKKGKKKKQKKFRTGVIAGRAA